MQPSSIEKAPDIEPRRLPWIDWLRFLAAFMVLLVHVRGVAVVEYGALPEEQRNLTVAVFFLLTRLRREAVLLFFVLSGFLVGGRLFDRVVSGDFDWKDYALDRLTRIYIPLLPALALSGVVAWFTQAPAGPAILLGNVLGLQQVLATAYGGNDPLWTLAYEIWFYALGGALACLVHMRRLTVLAGLVLLTSLAVFSVLGSSFLFCWLVGAVAWRTRPEHGSVTLGVLGLLMILAGSFGTQINIESDAIQSAAAGLRAWVPDQALVRLVMAGGFALLVQQLVTMQPGVWRTTLDQWGTRLAACSYTLYLTHYPVLALLHHFGWPRAARLDAAAFASLLTLLALSCLVAWALWFCFESRTTAVRRWLRLRWVG